MKKQLLLFAAILITVVSFAQDNREAFVQVRKTIAEAKSYNISLVWLDQKETDRNPAIRKELLSIFPELNAKALNQKTPDITLEVMVDKPRIIAEKNTTSVVTNNAQGHEVQLDYELPAKLIVKDQQGQSLYETRLNDLQNPITFRESFRYTDNNGMVSVNPKTNEPTQVRTSIKGYDRLNSPVNSTEYFKISNKKQTQDLRSLLNAWQSNWSNNKTVALK